MANDEKIRRLVLEIQSATEGGRLRWAETADADEFIAVMSNGKFFVKAVGYSGLDLNGDRVGNPVIELHRREDDALLMTIRGSDASIGWDTLEEIYKSARHRALGVDDALDEILDELNDIPF